MSAARTADLSGCASKLRRAREHIQDLDARTLHFIKEVGPYRGILDLDAQSGKTIVRLTHDVIQPPADEWSPIIGDIAHNLMSALDHLICQLSILHDGDAECEQTMFPVFDVNDAQGRATIKRRVGTLLDDDQRIVRDLQPYARGDLDAARADPLWLLYRLNVIDKHRRTHVTSTAIFDEAPIIARGYAITDLERLEGTKAGDEIFRFRWSVNPNAIEYDEKPQVIVQIKFGPGSGPLVGRSVRSELPALLNYVRNNVFPKFARRVGALPPDVGVTVRSPS